MNILLFLLFFSFVLGMRQARKGRRARGWTVLVLCVVVAAGYYRSLGLI